MGHYIAYSRRFDQDSQTYRWFEFNDSKVSEVAEETVRKTEAYLLFYEQKSLTMSNLSPTTIEEPEQINSTNSQHHQPESLLVSPLLSTEPVSFQSTPLSPTQPSINFENNEKSLKITTQTELSHRINPLNFGFIFLIALPVVNHFYPLIDHFWKIQNLLKK